MNILRFTAWHVVIPLKRTVRHASHSRRSTDNFVVKCELNDGTVGWGESVPRSYVTGDTVESVCQMFRECDLNSVFGGSLTIDETLGRIADWIPAVATTDANTNSSVRDCFGNCLKCAVELSVLDAIGRFSDCSVSDLIRRIPNAAPVLETSNQVQYSTAITTMKPRKQFLQALLMRAYGFRQTKLKVGAEGIDDQEMLHRVRRLVGSKMDLRVDANEAWVPNEVEAKMAPLLDYDISSLEQPVAHSRVMELASVRKNLPVPIMLDESLCSPGDAQLAIDNRTCDLFNIRISKCGGIIASVRLAVMAHAAGLGYQLGCQVGESGILSAAGRHLACSIAGIRFLEGSFDSHLVHERLTKQNLTFGYGGRAKAISGPGLGINVDQPAVERISKRTDQRTIS